MAHYLVDNYSIRLWSSRTTGQSGPDDASALAGIYVYEGDERRGQIHFYADNVELRPPLYREDKGQILLSLYVSQLQGTLEMLENQAVKIFYNSPIDAGIMTERMPPSVSGIGTYDPAAVG